MHRTTREGDEYVCTCGLRWGTDEDDPHPSTFEEHVAQMREALRKSEECES